MELELKCQKKTERDNKKDYDKWVTDIMEGI